MEDLIGLSPEQMQRLSAAFGSASDALAQSRNNVTLAVVSAWWSGSTADRFRAAWAATMVPRLIGASMMLQDESNKVRRQLEQQVLASSASGVSLGWGGTSSAGSAGANAKPPERWKPPDRGAGDFANGLLEMTRDDIPSGHFRVIALDGDPPRMIIIMPGVENLTKGLESAWAALRTGKVPTDAEGRALYALVKEWSSKYPHERTMGNAAPAALLGYAADEYAKAVNQKLAAFMDEHGIPKGTEVAIVAHSYGSIASGNLVVNEKFNGGLVNVTHWMPTAAGQHDVHGLPSSTHMLSVDNAIDPVVHIGALGNEVEHLKTPSGIFEAAVNLNPVVAASGLIRGAAQGAIDNLHDTDTHITGIGGIKGAGHDQTNYEQLISKNPKHPFLLGLQGAYAGSGQIYDLDAKYQ